MHPLPRWDGNGRREGVRLHRVWKAGHHAQVLAQGLVVRQIEVVELRAVVVAGQPRQLLEVFGLELHDSGRDEAVRLLPPRDERLPK